MSERIPQRQIRYSGLIDVEKLSSCNPLIIGVGAIGFAVAKLLAAMGVESMTLVDFDKVEELNLGPQGWDAEDVGKFKTKAARDHLKAINPDINITLINDKFDVGSEMLCQLHSIVFACVDSMSARKAIFNAGPDLMIDTRMSAFTINNLLVDRLNDDSVKAYRDSLFDDADAFQAPCTQRVTGFTSAIGAGMAVNLLFQHLNGYVPLPQSFLYLDSMILQGGLDGQPQAGDPPADSSQESPEPAVASDPASDQP